MGARLDKGDGTAILRRTRSQTRLNREQADARLQPSTPQEKLGINISLDAHRPSVPLLEEEGRPQANTSTPSTLHHFWRNDLHSTAVASPQVSPISLNVETLFKYPIAELSKYLNSMRISTLKPEMIGDIEKEIDAVKFKEKIKILVSGTFPYRR